MGYQANAIIFYGMDFWRADEEPPEILDRDVDFDEIDEWLLAADGVDVNSLGYQAVRDLKAKLPVQRVRYQHYDVTSYALAVRGSVVEADQWEVKLVPKEHDIDPSLE